jgi:hypothetical protein
MEVGESRRRRRRRRRGVFMMVLCFVGVGLVRVGCEAWKKCVI